MICGLHLKNLITERDSIAYTQRWMYNNKYKHSIYLLHSCLNVSYINVHVDFNRETCMLREMQTKRN